MNFINHIVVVCPYCYTRLAIKRYKESFGYAKCDCDVYPIVSGILYLQKDDTMANRRAVLSIKNGRMISALWLALGGTRIQRIMVIAAYMLKTSVHMLMSRLFLLNLLKYVSPNRTWFTYLLSQRDEEIQLAVRLIQPDTSNTSVILDIGFGIGHLYESFRKNTPRFSGVYVGIDKNCLSLFIARLYIPDTNLFLICGTADTGIPLPDNSIDKAIFLDSLAYIYSKELVIRETARVLKRKGAMHIVHMYHFSEKTCFWGYGVSPNMLERIVHTYFHTIRIFNTGQSNNKKGILLQKQNYSCSAVKD